MNGQDTRRQEPLAHLLHVDTPRVALPLKVIMASVLAWTFVLGVWLIFEDTVAGIVMFAVTAFDALVFRAVIPRRYEIWSSRVRIVLGGPLAFTIPLHDVAEARAVAGGKAYFYWGLRLATTNRGVVEIVRRRGLNMVISPADRETFLQRLSQAVEAASTLSGESSR